MMKKILVLLLLIQAGVAQQVNAAQMEEKVFQPNGENLLIQPPSGWRLASMSGDPNGDYAIEFTPQNEGLEDWREGYMSVQRGAVDVTPGAQISTQLVQRLLQVVQRNCPGNFMAMPQKDSMTNGAYTSVSGGFCDHFGSTLPFGEGSVVAAIEGAKHLFLVQFGWRPATENAWKDYGWRITPQKLQQYLDVLNQATLCGGRDQPACPR